MPTMYDHVVSVPLTDGPDSSGSVSGSATYSFPSNVISAIAAIQSFSVTYDPDHDHNVQVVGASCSVQDQNDSHEVTVKGSAQLKDNSSNEAQPDRSTMDVAVIAWCE